MHLVTKKLRSAYRHGPTRFQSECMYVYIPTYIHTCIHTHEILISTGSQGFKVNVCMQSMYKYILTYIHTYIHTYVCIHTYIRMYTYIHTYMRMYTYIHTYVYIHTCIYTHISLQARAHKVSKTALERRHSSSIRLTSRYLRTRPCVHAILYIYIYIYIHICMFFNPSV
jgi:hypothetical protein